MGAFPPYPRAPAVPRGQADIAHQEVITAGGSKAGARVAPRVRRAAVVGEGASPSRSSPRAKPLVPRTLINCLNIGSQRANKRRGNDLESKKHPAHVAKTIMRNPRLIYG
jgi:hypothetical protein